MSAQFTDWVSICETKARYCRCLDTKDWEGYAEVFTEDLELDTSRAGGFVVKGRDSAIRAIRSAVEAAKTAHQVHNPEMRFSADGQSADVIWAMNDRVIWAPEQAALLGNQGHTGYGHYDEHYVKGSDGVWRIKRQALSYLTFDIVATTA